MAHKFYKGFTLLELLIVIAILAVLATITVLILNPNQLLKNSRNAKRISDLEVINKALQNYNLDNGAYPDTNGKWRSQCGAWGSYSATNVIPGLTPIYLANFPADPQMDTGANTSCYVYKSDGADYKLLDIYISENSASDYLKYPSLLDPARDGGAKNCFIDGSNPTAWAYYDSGATCW